MSAIVSWEYYSSLYDKVTNAEFTKAEARAEKEVRNVIGPLRWNNITEQSFGYEELKDCICLVINQMKDNDDLELGKGVTSVSNDGYSESYAVANAEDVHQELQRTIKSALSGTGLVVAY